MNNIDYKKLKDITITFNKKTWDAEAFNVLVSFNVTMQKFDVILIKKTETKETEIKDFTDANNILKKFQLK